MRTIECRVDFSPGATVPTWVMDKLGDETKHLSPEWIADNLREHIRARRRRLNPFATLALSFVAGFISQIL